MMRLFTLILCLFTAQVLAGTQITVIDEHNRPINNAVVTYKRQVYYSDQLGHATLPTLDKGTQEQVIVRQIGYKRILRVAAEVSKNSTFQLQPFMPKALYLSVYGVGSQILRGEAIKIAKNKDINALVIGVKADDSIIPWETSVDTAQKIGARRVTTVKDPKALIADLHAQGFYLIARVVVFKDLLFAKANPQWAIKTAKGDVFVDREKLQWVDPSISATWDYSASIAEEAAQMGFDEIQFDYVRFPDRKGLVFSKPNTLKNRVDSIVGFLDHSRSKLAPYNVFMSADIFGYVLWNIDDTSLGQHLETIINHVDYVSPMLYPSGFQFGIPGYPNPMKHPYEIIYLSLKRALERTQVSAIRFRPWIQAFRDYAFGASFGSHETKLQIDAAQKFGSHGYMIWNPYNRYQNYLDY